MTDTVEHSPPVETTELLSTNPQHRPPVRSRLAPLRVWRTFWRQLTSMRTALLLLALLALAAIPGTVIPQRGLDPTKVNAFLTHHPHLGPLMDKVSLFDVFAAPWFAAIYLLLFVSLIGCLVPRIRLHARALRRRPPAAPRHLLRLSASESWTEGDSAADVAQRVHDALRSRRWRADLRTEPDGAVTVSAEKGYLRETGNLVFHVSLVVLLLGIGLSGLFGYKGTVLVQKGGTFANEQVNYDVFSPSRLFHSAELSPFVISLRHFSATYQSDGEPTAFDAAISYRSSPTATVKPYDIRVNHPLNVPGAKVFLVGHGYSMRLKVTNKAGQVVSNGDVPFLPDTSTFASHGVLKLPDEVGTSRNDEIGLVGEFYPTLGLDSSADAISTYPGLNNPVLELVAYRGNLGIDTGAAQSDYSLPVGSLRQIAQDDSLTVGRSWKLPNGVTVQFEGIDQWATFQVAHTPGKTVVLLAAIGIIAGLLGSLRVKRRRFWIRATPAGGGAADGQAGRTVVTAAGLARSDTDGFAEALPELLRQVGAPSSVTSPPGQPTENDHPTDSPAPVEDR